jgi:catechol 2,3-dioxygenase-like lactoylglutathione lyase family enzyme
MSTMGAKTAATATIPTASRFSLKLEVVTLPVTDVELAKKFYAGLGWRLDADFVKGDDFRVIQFTPPGSPCSIHLGKGLTSAAPGSAQNLYLVVADIALARAELVRRGVPVSEVFHRVPGADRLNGPDPRRQSYASFATFADPDANGWVLQEVTARLPGRVDSEVATFASATELAIALRRAESAHTEHEKLTGRRDANWSDWYAEYIVREQTGRALPT